MVRRASVVVVGLAVLATVVGCSSAVAPARDLSTAEVSAVLSGAAENGTFLHDATEQLVLRCMKRAGYPYETTPAMDGLPDPFKGSRLTAAAAREGYGLRRSADQRPPRDFVLDFTARLPPKDAERYMTVLNGTEDQTLTVRLPDGSSVSVNRNGCRSVAQQRVYGDFAAYIRLSQIALNVRGEASREIEADPAYVDAQKAWSRCMTDVGFAYPSRRKVQDDFAKRYVAAGADKDAVFRAEVATAKADAGCSTRTGFDRVSVEAQQRATTVAVSRYEGDLVAFRELNAESVGRAKRALASS